VKRVFETIDFVEMTEISVINTEIYNFGQKCPMFAFQQRIRYLSAFFQQASTQSRLE
jgi:hypothetical protein